MPKKSPQSSCLGLLMGSCETEDLTPKVGAALQSFQPTSNVHQCKRLIQAHLI